MDLRANTAVDVLIGPFIDKTDGNTAEDALTLTAAEIKLSKNGQALTLKSDVTTAAFDDDGYYNCELDATDTNTEGSLVLIVHQAANALPVRHEYNVMAEAAWDSLYVAKDTGFMDVNMKAISEDETAADNLELQYDGTGLAGDTFPSSQSQVGGIGSGSAGSTNFAAVEDNAAGAIIDGITKVGTPTGTFTNTEAEDGVIHSIAAVGNDIDWVYGFNVTGAKQGTEVALVVNVNGNADEMKIQVYDHIGVTWNTIGTIPGSGGVSFINLNADLLSKHTGTGAELGKVYIRFETLSTTPSLLEIDKAIVRAVSTATSVGYSLGSYWVSSAGVSGTEIGTNGTADNPCPWADAVTMNGVQPLNRFQIANGNTVTLAASADAYSLFGKNWILELGSRSIEGMTVEGAAITGIGTATVTRPTFTKCIFGAATIPPAAFVTCGFGANAGTFTAGSAGDYLFVECLSVVEGMGTPVFVFSGLGPTTGVNMRAWSGGSDITLDSNCTTSLEIRGGGNTTIVTGGADVEVRGVTRSLTVTMSAAETVQFVGTVGPITLSGTTTGNVNLYGIRGSLSDTTTAASVTDETVSRENIPDDVWDEVLSGATHNIASSAGRRLREGYDSHIIHTGTAQGPGTGSNQIQLATAASSTDGMYDPSVITIHAGPGEGQSRYILEYDGATRIATVGRAWKTNPTSASEYHIIADPGHEHVNEGLAQAGAASTITLNALASSVDGTYVRQVVFIRSGAGEDQARVVTAYNGTTKIATVDRVWETNPDSTSAYVMQPLQEQSNDVTPPSVAEFNARTILAADYFDPDVDDVANVTLVTTVTTNTDMRGTDNAALASVCTEVRLAELDAGNLPADNVALNTLLLDIPTVAEFNARTLIASSYFDPAADAVAVVTLVGTVTTNTDLVTASAITDAVLDEAISGHQGAGSVGKAISDAVGGTVVSGG